MIQLDIETNRNKESWKQSGVIQFDIETNRNKEMETGVIQLDIATYSWNKESWKQSGAIELDI